MGREASRRARDHPSVPDSRAADPSSVAEKFLSLSRTRFGRDVAWVDSPRSISEGFDTAIVFVHLSGANVPDEWRRPLVLRVHPSPERLGLARRSFLEQELQNNADGLLRGRSVDAHIGDETPDKLVHLPLSPATAAG